jgi:SRSO17 transposase
MDRELYLPTEWAADAARRTEAHVPEQVGFHTKPQLAKAMLERALDAGVPAGWVTADEVYGGDARLRAFLEWRPSGAIEHARKRNARGSAIFG